jgi:hemerythrin-like domain-containing protein
MMKCAAVSSETKTGQGTTTGEGHYAVKKTVHFLSENVGERHHGKEDIT